MVGLLCLCIRYALVLLIIAVVGRPAAYPLILRVGGLWPTH